MGMLEVAQARGRSGGHWEQAKERRIKSRPVKDVKMWSLALLDDGVPPLPTLGSGNIE